MSAVMNGVSSIAVPKLEFSSGLIPLGYSCIVACVVISFDGTSMNDTEDDAEGLIGVGVFRIPREGGFLPCGPEVGFGDFKRGWIVWLGGDLRSLCSSFLAWLLTALVTIVPFRLSVSSFPVISFPSLFILVPVVAPIILFGFCQFLLFPSFVKGRSVISS